MGKPKLSPLEVRWIVFLSVLAGVLLLGFFLVLILRNMCVLGGGGCTHISYQQKGSELLVRTSSGAKFYFDGTKIYDYNDVVTGAKCSVGVGGATKNTPPVAVNTEESVVYTCPSESCPCVRHKPDGTCFLYAGCLRFNPDGSCQEYSKEPVQYTTARRFPGERFDTTDDFSARFTVDAAHMEINPGNLFTCVINYNLIQDKFRDAPVRTLRVRRREGQGALNIYEVFAALEGNGIFRRPARPAREPAPPAAA